MSGFIIGRFAKNVYITFLFMKEKIEAYCTMGNKHQCLQLFARASRELATLQVNLGDYQVADYFYVSILNVTLHSLKMHLIFIRHTASSSNFFCLMKKEDLSTFVFLKTKILTHLCLSSAYFWLLKI